MITWGITANSHDASLAVFNGNELLCAALAKDFSGVPNDPHLNSKLVNFALDRAGGPSKIIWYERPFLKSLRQLRAGQGLCFKENNVRNYLKKYIGYKLPISYTQHHESHAAYAYYTQPYDHCAVICLDSIGEFECLTIWDCYDNKMHKIHSQNYPHSLGLFYSAMTQRVGLVPQRDEYLIVEMAKRGNAEKVMQLMLDELIDIKIDGIHMKENLHRGCKWWHPELCSQQDLYDIAAATQAIFEQSLVNLSTYAKYYTNAKHLALAGGGALNKQAINLIRHQWDSVWVPPNPGDPGSCIGAVLAKTKQRINNVDKLWFTTGKKHDIIVS